MFSLIKKKKINEKATEMSIRLRQYLKWLIYFNQNGDSNN